MIQYEESEIEKLRRVNIARNEEELRKLFPKEFLKTFKSIPVSSEIKKKRRRDTPRFKLADLIPRKKLSRSCKRTIFDENDDDDENDENAPPRKINRCEDDETWREDDETSPDRKREIIKFKWSKLPSPHKTKSFVSLRPFDAVKEEDLVLVAEQVSEKHYDSINGTSCHQCRQKTDDLKTVCRSGRCLGIRGQFCGPCLRNRYGESAKEAILNPEWECPSCRGICNCSFCMKRRGRRATGILIHLAKERGFSNVKSYLGD